MELAKKSLGQNFLIDKNIIRKIVSLVDLKNKDIIEIGPGHGALTDEIFKRKPRSLFLIEKDKKLTNKLKEKYQNDRFVEVLNYDFLKIDLERILKKETVILGNLPYNISSQILIKIIKLKRWPPKFSDLVLMFQKELSERILGKYSTSNYGRLSILTNYRLKIQSKFTVSPNCFFPKPKILSEVIHFKPKSNFNIKIKNISNLEKVTNTLFSNKRKMINKNIKKIIKDDKFYLLKGINFKSRPSDLNPDFYYKLTEILEKD